MNEPIERLAQLHGIGTSYHDYRGELRVFSRETKVALLAAMGAAAATDAEATTSIQNFEAQEWMHLAPPVWVTTPIDVPDVPISVPGHLGAAALSWTLTLESGVQRAGEFSLSELAVRERREINQVAFTQHLLPLPTDLPVGYHTLHLVLNTGLAATLRLIVAPRQCHQPAAIAAGERVWGIAVQLYALRSDSNWGIGDFRDLRALIRSAAPLGCAVIGLNPLHALMPANPAHISPYSPSNRQFLNTLYISVEDIPEFARCEPARTHVSAAEFQARLAELRATTRVEYAQVAAAKAEVTRLLYAHFRQHELTGNTPRAEQFRQFVAERGEPLRLHALYDALDAHLRLQGPQYDGWPSWPDEYRDPTSHAVNRFARERAEDVEYFLYLQWIAEQQLWDNQRLAREQGMSIGLYGDVAVGANPAGSESWSNRSLYVQDAAIGAPPDPLALKGQDWGIPPQSPQELRAQAYQPFIDLLRSNMRPVAALRLDHVMTLLRLWWVPRGYTSTDGAYVHYPLADLIAILTLESERNHCVVVGEDLGTVPDQMRTAMEQHAVYHYKVLLFEQAQDGSFKAPAAYARNALATVTTHDLPTLRGWWESHDLQLRDQLDLYPTAQIREESYVTRERDRVQLLHALTRNGLWRWQAHEPLPDYSPALSRAVHAYLGLSNANMVLVQIEDLIGMTDPVNVPGTSDEYPNWQRKVSMNTAQILQCPEVLDLLGAMNSARRGINPNQ